MATTKWTGLTLSYLKSRLHYNPETGVFIWLFAADYPPEWNTRRAGKEAGSKQPDCININLDKRLFKAHQLAWFYMTGVKPERHVDHENTNQHDNRWVNLRLAAHSQNLFNRTKTVENTTGFKGVIFLKGRRKYRAQIDAYKRHYNLGNYNTAEEAHAAYVKAARRLHGEFARTE
jgi:hypothetical protein